MTLYPIIQYILPIGDTLRQNAEMDVRYDAPATTKCRERTGVY
jgi:hypothetical protein